MLFTYVATLLANHAAGLISLAAAEVARSWFIAAWRSIPLTVLFYSALVVHIVLAFVAIHERRTLRMPLLEFVRMLLGLSIPFLLASHFTGPRLAYELYGRDDDYGRVVAVLWSNDKGLRQLVLMCLAWLPGCLGIHFLLRHRRVHREGLHWFFGGALLLPVLAALGFLAMAREIPLRIAPGGEPAAIVLDAASSDQLAKAATLLIVSFAAALAIVLAARVLRSWSERRRGLVLTLTYPHRSVTVPRGWSVLEALPGACRQALAAAQAIEAGIETGAECLRRDFGHSFEFGIGIHAGRAAVGEVGWQETRTFTAVGDAVNTAARLQELCKAYDVRLVASQQVLQSARIDVSGLTRQTLPIRGRSEGVGVYAIASPAALSLERPSPAVSGLPSFIRGA